MVKKNYCNSIVMIYIDLFNCVLYGLYIFVQESFYNDYMFSKSIKDLLVIF